MRLGGRVALVHLVHGQMEASMQLSAEAASALGIVVRGAVAGLSHPIDRRFNSFVPEVDRVSWHHSEKVAEVVLRQDRPPNA